MPSLVQRHIEMVPKKRILPPKLILATDADPDSMDGLVTPPTLPNHLRFTNIRYLEPLFPYFCLGSWPSLGGRHRDASEVPGTRRARLCQSEISYRILPSKSLFNSLLFTLSSFGRERRRGLSKVDSV